MKKIKALLAAASVAAVLLGVAETAHAVKEERNGDFSREFPDIQEELKQAVKDAGGKINE